ncbi:MAG: ABC transporter ATP-binding protein [Halobacteriales archaeon]|nr:ABC transporter ATP-binding protein [Halobacteriales archaeon]
MIRTEDVSFAYREATEPAVRSVDMTVEAGQTVAVMGPNGSGKTTLLKLVAGLLEPDTGTIRIDGIDPANAADRGAGLIGFAPEDPGSFLFAETVAEEVAFFPENRGLNVEERVASALEAMDIEALRDRVPYSLSVGEQRRVAIASLLAGDPTVLALDEPNHGLHATGARTLGQHLASIGKTVILTTHSADFAYRFVDTVVVLADGEIKATGPAKDMLTDRDLLIDAGIRPPGLVEWAHRNGITPVPRTVDEALASVDGGEIEWP